MTVTCKKTVNENSKLSFTVTALDKDGDALTYSASNLPFGAVFDTTTGVFSWTPDYSQSGTYSAVHFQVTDGNAIDSEDITIVIVKNSNQPPVLNFIGSKSISENSELTFTLSATDPDGDTLVYSAHKLPSGAAFNQNTATFSWTPTKYQSETYKAVRFKVSDGTLTDSEEITITVTNINQAPVLAYIGKKTVNTNSELNFTVTASDKDGDTLTYSVSNLPSGAVFDTTTHIFSWTPTSSQAGSYAVIFNVTDTNGASDSKTVSIRCKLKS